MHPPHLDWPFFDDRHRELAASLGAWLPAQTPILLNASTDATAAHRSEVNVAMPQRRGR